MNSFCELISKVGGGVLAIDYGDTFGFSDSIRVDSLLTQGIANHKFVPNDLLLEFPGQIDLSAYVNFIALAQACGENSKRILT
jgi:NADH dehydrogenase [ubiquinone] 1 alpha subcomplex assembly factor 7